MASPECKKFDDCSAPLCPIEIDKLKPGSPWLIWYPDEEVCQLKGARKPDWVKKQRLIVRSHGSTAGFFSLNMLQGIGRVQRGITGANPDLGIKAERQWLESRRV